MRSGLDAGRVMAVVMYPHLMIPWAKQFANEASSISIPLLQRSKLRHILVTCPGSHSWIHTQASWWARGKLAFALH